MNFYVIRFYLLLPALVGLVAGLLVLVFAIFLQLLIGLFLNTLLGIETPSPPGLKALISFDSKGIVSPYLLPLVVVVGAILSELLVLTFSKESLGMSTDTVIRAYHGKAKLSLKTSVVKLAASAIVIGTGGTAGRLAPSALAGAGVADFLAKFLRLSSSERRILIAVGFGAGLSAVLKAPLAGAIMSAEIFFRRDFDIQTLLPSFVASIVSYSVFGSVYGFEPLFKVSTVSFSDLKPSQLLMFIGLALFCVLWAKAFVLLFNNVRKILYRIVKRNLVRVLAGSLISGFTGLVSPFAVAGGLGWIQALFDREFSLHTLVLALSAVGVGVSFLIGSGASGGLFGPIMVMGAIVGTIYASLVGNLVEVHVPSVVVVGMASFLAGTVNAPLSSIMLVSEITGEYELLIPSMLSVFITYLMTSRDTVFPSQVDTRFDSPAYRNELGMFVLERLKVKDYMSRPVTVSPEDSLRKAKELMDVCKIGGLPVVKSKNLVGMVTRSDLQGIPDRILEKKKVSDVMSVKLYTAVPEDTLSDALKVMVNRGVGRLPVVDKRGSRLLVGIISRRDIGRAIKESLG